MFAKPYTSVEDTWNADPGWDRAATEYEGSLSSGELKRLDTTAKLVPYVLGVVCLNNVQPGVSDSTRVARQVHPVSLHVAGTVQQQHLGELPDDFGPVTARLIIVEVNNSLPANWNTVTGASYFLESRLSGGTVCDSLSSWNMATLNHFTVLSDELFPLGTCKNLTNLVGTSWPNLHTFRRTFYFHDDARCIFSDTAVIAHNVRVTSGALLAIFLTDCIVQNASPYVCRITSRFVYVDS